MTDQHVEQVRIELRTEPGQSLPHEAMTWNIPDDLSEEAFAAGEELVTVQEHMEAFLSTHLSGECECISGEGENDG